MDCISAMLRAATGRTFVGGGGESGRETEGCSTGFSARDPCVFAGLGAGRTGPAGGGCRRTVVSIFGGRIIGAESSDVSDGDEVPDPVAGRAARISMAWAEPWPSCGRTPCPVPGCRVGGVVLPERARRAEGISGTRGGGGRFAAAGTPRAAGPGPVRGGDGIRRRSPSGLPSSALAGVGFSEAGCAGVWAGEGLAPPDEGGPEGEAEGEAPPIPALAKTSSREPYLLIMPSCRTSS